MSGGVAQVKLILKFCFKLRQDHFVRKLLKSNVIIKV